MVPSLATLLEKSYLTKTNPRAPEQQGVLQHKNGKCVKAYLPAPMKVTKNIPESQSALVRLVKNCKYADEWQITESFVLRNKNYNLTVHPYNLNTKDQTKVRFISLNPFFCKLFVKSGSFREYQKETLRRIGQVLYLPLCLDIQH